MTDICPIKLYHGTSSIFLKSIKENGLGGVNVIKEWGIIDLAKEILPLVEESFPGHINLDSFRRMANQEITANGINFQHGDVYLSPSEQKAVEYTARKRWGSEIISYSLNYLEKLIAEENPVVVNHTFKRKYIEVYKLLNIYAAPLLIEVSEIPYNMLLDEQGNEVSAEKKSEIEKCLKEMPDCYQEILQCENFRLKCSLPVESLDLKMISVSSCGLGMEYNLYSLNF